MAVQNINFRADLNLPKQDSLPKETKNEQVGTGQFAANSGVFHAKENVKNQDQGQSGGRGSGAPADNFVGELVVGGYNSEISAKNRSLPGGTFGVEGDLRRKGYFKMAGPDAGTRALKLENGVDYALPSERSKISHAVHMAYVNKPIDMHHELNALTRQVALNRSSIRV